MYLDWEFCSAVFISVLYMCKCIYMYMYTMYMYMYIIMHVHVYVHVCILILSGLLVGQPYVIGASFSEPHSRRLTGAFSLGRYTVYPYVTYVLS